MAPCRALQAASAIPFVPLIHVPTRNFLDEQKNSIESMMLTFALSIRSTFRNHYARSFCHRSETRIASHLSGPFSLVKNGARTFRSSNLAIFVLLQVQAKRFPGDRFGGHGGEQLASRLLRLRRIPAAHHPEVPYSALLVSSHGSFSGGDYFPLSSPPHRLHLSERTWKDVEGGNGGCFPTLFGVCHDTHMFEDREEEPGLLKGAKGAAPQ